MILRSLKNFAQIYNKWSLHRPILTMSVTTGVVHALGSFTCQTIANMASAPADRKPIDLNQIARFTLFGAVVVGPVLKYWWYMLDLKIFKNKKLFLRPVQMMLVDQVVFRWPIIAAFVLYLNVTSGQSFQKSYADFSQRIGPIIKDSIKIWPAATLISFYLIPLHLRILYANVVAYCWNTYMAWLDYKALQARKELDL